MLPNLSIRWLRLVLAWGAGIGLAVLGGGGLATGRLFQESAAWADVIVLANRTEKEAVFSVEPVNLPAVTYKVAAGDLAVAPMLGLVNVAYDAGGVRKTLLLSANSAYYYVAASNGERQLLQVDLGGTERTSRGTGVANPKSFNDLTTLPIKILVDEDERAADKVWEARLRRRVANASEIFQKYCRIKLEVVEVSTWQSDNRLHEFEDSLKEFEQEVQPGKAQIAIGFTSQYEIPQGRTHLGGTRGPLHQHILIREWSQHITEAERLEVLIHELGHVLGAAHSPDQNSVMRPMLGDRKARLASFRIGFDPPNTVAMNLIGEEIRMRGVKKIADLTPASILRLREIYGAIDKALPDDPAAAGISGMLARQSLDVIADSTKKILRELSRAAKANAALPTAKKAPAGAAVQRTGDELTEYYLRQCALAARELPPGEAGAALLLGLGIGLDDAGFLNNIPQLKAFSDKLETEAERAERNQNLGEFAMHGRGDLARHFVVSALLTAIGGPRQAEALGLAKEFVDTQRNSGFSFVDLAADRAGIRFAEGLLKGKFTLQHVADDFTVKYFMPDISGLPEGLTAADFLVQFGSPADARFLQVIRDIDTRLQGLPPYREQVAVPLK